MKRRLGLTLTLRFLAISLLVTCPVGLAAQPLRIVADSYDFDEARGILTAEGKVELQFERYTLAADSLTCSLSPDRESVQSVEATGKVSLFQSTETYDAASTCARALYQASNAGTRRIVLDKAHIEITYHPGETGPGPGPGEGFIASEAHQIELVERQDDKSGSPIRVMTINEGWITTCDRPRPHYRIRAKQLTVVEDEYVRGRGVSVELGSLRVPTLPTVRFNLRETAMTGFFPVIGHNIASGFFTRWYYDLTDQPRALRLSFQESQRRSPSWGIEGFAGGNPRFFWAAAAREDTRSTLKRGLTVSRSPQTGANARIGKYFEATLDWGRFREFPGDAESERIRARARMSPLRLLRAGKLTLSASGEATRAWYGGRHRYRSSSLNLQGDLGLGGGNSIMLAYIIGSTNRDTPFYFDDLDILRELRGGFTYVAKAGTLDFVARYDLDRGSFFAYTVALAINHHCLLPKISYDSRDRELRFEMRLAGF
jgi:hypothetical protein